MNGLEEESETLPMLESTVIPVLYFDDLDFMDTLEGNARFLAWRFKRVAGQLLRDPVVELIRPAATIAASRVRVDRALALHRRLIRKGAN